MRIIQVTPGVIPIPPNGWGAVEKIIWEYKLSLSKLGYQVDILYADDVKKSDNQVVHVHMANLANLLHSRGIEYVFSLHDHHVEHFGKSSDCYNENYRAIKNSKLTFVHSKHLIDFFDNLPQIVYLPHGANLNDYGFVDRSGSLASRKPKLLMMANNGVGGDPLNDRKGFLIGIEAAKRLGLDITVICPSSNKKFFEHHQVNCENLEIIYDLDYEDSLDILKKFDLFLHPSNLEAGHPNLTITESISSGIPVVGVINTEIPGMIRVERGVEEFISGIKLACEKYDSLCGEISNERYQFSWDIIVSRMLENYKQFFNISQKSQLLHTYQTTKVSMRDKLSKLPITSSFNSHKFFVKTAVFSPGLTAIFKDMRTNTILFQCEIGKEPGNWAYIFSDRKTFVDISIQLKSGVCTVWEERLDLKGKRVLLEVNNNFDGISDVIKSFTEKTGCFITTCLNKVPGFQFDSSPNSENFYFSLTCDQLLDFHLQKKERPDSQLLILTSGALGDNLGFLPYAQIWAENLNLKVDVAMKFHHLFDKSKYPHLEIISTSDINFSKYTDISRFEYDFHKPLQRGYCEQFVLQFNEVRPHLNTTDSKSPIKGKYVVLGVHTTAQCKYWNYPGGWEILSKWLRKQGYTPVAVDLHEVFGIEGHWNHLPQSAVKKVGLPMSEVITLLNHSEFFIGVSSGLSWLAWSLGKKVVMISGTTEDGNEFSSNNYRVINKSVCNGCFNQKKYKFDSGDWLWCPVNRGTDKWFECSRTITPEMVIEKIKLIESSLVI